MNKSRPAGRGVVEFLEPRFLLNATLVSDIPAETVSPGAPVTTINLGSYFNDLLVTGTAVEIHTPKGDIPIALTDAQTPRTVANFVAHVNSGDYNGTIIDLAIAQTSLSGGGFFPDGSSVNNFVPVQGEDDVSYPTGSISMAPDGFSQPASEWYVNLASPYSGPGFGGGPWTPFGNLIYGGLGIAQSLANVPTVADTASPRGYAVQPWQRLPVLNYSGPNPAPSVPSADLLSTSTAVVPALTFNASSDNSSLVTPSISGTTLSMRYGGSTGVANITVTATDLGGGVARSSFSVRVGALANSTTTLTSTSNTASVGMSVSFAATVAPASPGGALPTGTVAFLDNGGVLGTATLQADGVGTVSTSSLPAGVNVVTAQYDGDSTYAPSTSSPLTETVDNVGTPPATPHINSVTSTGAVFSPLVIHGTFNDGVQTVVHVQGAGFTQDVPAVATATDVSAIVPLYSHAGRISGAKVSLTVLQTERNAVLRSNKVASKILNLPASHQRAGGVTASYLSQQISALSAAQRNLSGSPADTPAIDAAISAALGNAMPMLSDVQAVMAGTVRSVLLGAVSGKPILLKRTALAYTDRILAAESLAEAPILAGGSVPGTPFAVKTKLIEAASPSASAMLHHDRTVPTLVQFVGLGVAITGAVGAAILGGSAAAGAAAAGGAYAGAVLLASGAMYAASLFTPDPAASQSIRNDARDLLINGISGVATSLANGFGAVLRATGKLYDAFESGKTAGELLRAAANGALPVTLTVVPVSGTDGSGTVQVSPQKSQYAVGDVVTLTPQPDSGSAFSHWVINGNQTDNSDPLILTLQSDTTVSAYFTKQEPELSVLATTPVARTEELPPTAPGLDPLPNPNASAAYFTITRRNGLTGDLLVRLDWNGPSDFRVTEAGNTGVELVGGPSAGLFYVDMPDGVSSARFRVDFILSVGSETLTLDPVDGGGAALGYLVDSSQGGVTIRVTN